MRAISIYHDIANLLIYQEKMDKATLVDWYLQQQREGFCNRTDIQVNELVYIQDNVRKLASTRKIIDRDKVKIRARQKHETTTAIANSYYITRTVLLKYLNKKENV